MKLAALRRFRRHGDDYAKTRDLKRYLASLRLRRSPFYLTLADLDRILRWKLRTQYGRTAKFRAKHLKDSHVRSATRAAFAHKSTNRDAELRVRTRHLADLPGVGIPVASAILALVEPRSYCVVDFRGWRAIFGEDRRRFSIPDYCRYRSKIAGYAKRLGWTVQDTDAAVWAYDRQRSQRY